MYCSRCGAQNAADAQFCAKCGNALGSAPPPPGAPPPSPSVPPAGTPPAAAPPPGGFVIPPYEAGAPKKPRSMAARIGCIGCAGLIGIVLLIFIIAAMSNKGGNTTAQRSSGQKTTASSLAGTHTTIHFKDSKKTLDGVLVDDTLYGVYSTRLTSTIGGTEFTEPTRAAGRFVVIEMLVRNESKKAREISLSSSTLIDAQGNSYSTSSEGETALMMSGDKEAEFLLSELQPGLQKFLKITFDVPAGKKKFTLKIPHSVFGGGEDGELAVNL